jgi:hypothetical protein
MLIILICANLIVLGFILVHYAPQKNEGEDDLYIMGGTSAITIGGMAICVALLILLMNGAESRETANQLNIDCANLRYYITHQENYKERSLVEHINEYNAKLKDFRAKQSSPWLNWFYPGDVSECEYFIWRD